MAFAANLATVAGVPLGIASLIYTGVQIKRATQVERSRFLLELEQLISSHAEVHRRLRRGGDWSEGSGAPANAEEWSKVDDYMAFFEHCEFLIKEGALSFDNFKVLYAYRIHNILSNKAIVSKVKAEIDSWLNFKNLVIRLNGSFPEI